MSLELVPVALLAAALGVVVEKVLTFRRSLLARRRSGASHRAESTPPERRPLLDTDAVAMLIELGYSRREALEAIARGAGAKARERALRAFKDNGARFVS